MPFPSELELADKNKIRAGKYSATPYLLVDNSYESANIVFQAQINQTVFASTFAAITFDNVTKGAITDVLDGFTVYISDSDGDIRGALEPFRARGDQIAGTTLNINETSAALEENQYITVTKDVMVREKLGLYTNKTLYVDWDITFRRLLPVIRGLKGAYVGILSGGQADFEFLAVGHATESASSISNWLWDADGGSFINGTVATDAQPEIRYTTAGVYMPRVSITDNIGNSNWFTFRVFVCSSDLSDDFIVTGIESLSINATITTGQQISVTMFSDEMENTPNNTFIAVWNRDDYNGDTDAIVDEIMAVGRLRRETPSHTIDNEYMQLQQTQFNIDGMLAQIGQIRSPQLAMRFESSPSEFGEINNMTQWRVIVFVLSEFSTVSNLCSIQFDDDSDDYLNRQESIDSPNLLDAINNVMQGMRFGKATQTGQGELYFAQNPNYLSDTDRDALTIITTLTSNDTFNQNITREHIETIGSLTAFAGAYSSTTDKLTVWRASAPAIASGRGQGIAPPVNGILLASDNDLPTQQDEMEQITGDALEDKNPKDIVRLDILDGYWFFMPCYHQWYRASITAVDNNRSITFSILDRFILKSLVLRYENGLGSWNVTPTIEHESQGEDAQIISQIVPGQIPGSQPIIPPVPAYPSYPPLDEIWYPDGVTPEEEPPISEGDGDVVTQTTTPESGNEQGNGTQSTESLKGNVVAIHNGLAISICDNFTKTELPDWAELYTASGGHSIKDFKWDSTSPGGYMVSNDGSDDSLLGEFPEYNPSGMTWTLYPIDDGLYSAVRPTHRRNGVLVYGKSLLFGGDSQPGGPGTWEIERLGGFGNEGLSPSSFIAHANNPSGPAQSSGGTYDSGNDAYNSIDTDECGAGGLTIEWPVPAGVRVTGVQATIDHWTSAAGPGERIFSIETDDETEGFTGGSLPKSDAGPILDTTYTNTGRDYDAEYVYFHFSVRGGKSGGVCVFTAFVNLKYLKVTGTSESDVAVTRYSASRGDGLQPALTVGDMTTGDGSFDIRYTGKTVAAKEEAIKKSLTPGTLYFPETDGDTPGTHAKALLFFTQSSDVNYLLATDDGTLYKIVAGVRTDITPNDGSDGIVVSQDGLAMHDSSSDEIWFLGSFGGTVKLAYTTDQGDNWSFSATAMNAAANAVAVKNSEQVYIANGNNILYSENGGASFVTKNSGLSNLVGIEVR